MQLSDLTDERIDGMGDRELEGALSLCGVRPIGWAASSMEAASCMETRLAEMGLSTQYATTLRTLFFADVLDDGDIFKLIHASPRDRCRAALRAVRDSKQREVGDG